MYLNRSISYRTGCKGDALFGKYPAITRNQYGKGTVTYEGTVLSNELQQNVLREVLNLAGLIGVDQQLPNAIRLKQGISNAGKMMRYYLNYSGAKQTFIYPHGAGIELLNNKAVTSAQKIELAPWDLVIIEEK